MRVIQNQSFSNLHYRTPSIIENIRFEKCIFGEGICLSDFIPHPDQSTIIRNCEFIGCTFYDKYSPKGGVLIGDAILEDVLFENCKTKGAFGLSFHETKLNNVVFRGNFDHLQLVGPTIHPQPSPLYPEGNLYERPVHPGPYTKDQVKWFTESYNAYNKKIEVAVDISEVRLKGFSVLGAFPCDKINFDFSTQAYMDGDTLKEGRWQELVKDVKGLLTVGLRVGKDNPAGYLLVACPRDKKYFNDDIELIRSLREKKLLPMFETAPKIIPAPNKKMVLSYRSFYIG